MGSSIPSAEVFGDEEWAWERLGRNALSQSESGGGDGQAVGEGAELVGVMGWPRVVCEYRLVG